MLKIKTHYCLKYLIPVSYTHLQDSGYYQNIYGETQSGQRAFLTELYAKLKQVLGGRCIGDLYWDPVMVYDGGTGQIGWAIDCLLYTSRCV